MSTRRARCLGHTTSHAVACQTVRRRTPSTTRLRQQVLGHDDALHLARAIVDLCCLLEGKTSPRERTPTPSSGPQWRTVNYTDQSARFSGPCELVDTCRTRPSRETVDKALTVALCGTGTQRDERTRCSDRNHSCVAAPDYARNSTCWQIGGEVRRAPWLLAVLNGAL